MTGISGVIEDNKRCGAISFCGRGLHFFVESKRGIGKISVYFNRIIAERKSVSYTFFGKNGIVI